MTAPGSSGSPLINAETGKVVGVLTGGLSDCHATGSPDYYGRLSAVSLSPLSRLQQCVEVSKMPAMS